MGRLVDATRLLVCRRIAHRVSHLAHRDWDWRKPLEQRSCRVEAGPL